MFSYGTEEFNKFRREVEELLAEKYGIHGLYGFKGAISQTGEKYTEVVLTGSNLSELAKMMAGAIAAFAKNGERLYWRIRPEYQETAWGAKQGYARFLVTKKPEIFSSEAEAKETAKAA